MKLAEHSHAPKSTNPVILMTIRPEPPLSHFNEQCKSSNSQYYYFNKYRKDMSMLMLPT